MTRVKHVKHEKIVLLVQTTLMGFVAMIIYYKCFVYSVDDSTSEAYDINNISIINDYNTTTTTTTTNNNNNKNNNNNNNNNDNIIIGLSALFLKNVAGLLAVPLSLLFRTSYELSTLPTIWKSAIVTRIFKKGSPSSASNYRPISFTCIICKLMEIIIKDRLIAYLLENNLISKQQHGFLTKHSTCSQLLECVNDWTIELNFRHYRCRLYRFSESV